MAEMSRLDSVRQPHKRHSPKGWLPSSEMDTQAQDQQTWNFPPTLKER